MTRASGSVHVLLPVTRRLIDSQPSCSVNVVYRVSSRPRCRVCRRLGESRRRRRRRRRASSFSFDVDETIYKES